MEALVGKFSDFLVTQGWAGVLVALICFAFWRQSKVLETMGDKLEAAYQKLNDTQEKRVTDAMTLVASNKDMSSSMDRLTDLIRDRKTAA